MHLEEERELDGIRHIYIRVGGRCHINTNNWEIFGNVLICVSFSSNIQSKFFGLPF